MIDPSAMPSAPAPPGVPLPLAGGSPAAMPAAMPAGHEDRLPRGLRPSKPPSRLGEIVRQWILLLPLTTALLGALAIKMAPAHDYVEYLPSFFFTGALLVTAAMLHQRHIFRLIYDLAHRLHGANEGLQGANARLHALHGLSLALNRSLDTRQVAETLLDHALPLLSAGEGALWVRGDFVPPTLPDDSSSGGAANETTETGPSSWRRVAVRGFAPSRGRVLDGWDEALSSGEGLRAVWSGVEDAPSGGASEGGQQALSALLEPGESAVSQPIFWENQIVGAMLLCSRDKRMRVGDLSLLSEIAVGAGSALQHALLYARATERAEIDGLTQLNNHRAVQERLGMEVARAARTRLTSGGAGLCVAMMDLCDFKLFNDTYGHAVGDKVLREVAETLRRTFRGSDFVGRYGGDEFAVLLPGITRDAAQRICARAVETMTARPFAAPDGMPVTIRLRCGVAGYPQDGETGAQLLAEADARLYKAKSRGQAMVEPSEETAKTLALPQAALVQVEQPDWNTIGLLDALIGAIDAKDHQTRAHAERVWHEVGLLTQSLDLPQPVREAIQIAGLVHDVGKISLPDALLRKPGRLTPLERAVMEQHPVMSALIVRDVPHHDVVRAAVRHHHEHWDGSGYPDGLQGEAIPLAARLLSITDAYAAMTAPRPHRSALSSDEALAELQRGAGHQFDPRLVEAYIRTLRQTTLPAEASASPEPRPHLRVVSR